MRTITSTVLLTFAAAAAVAQEPAAGWRLFGSNEIMVEDYRVTGDESISPFPFEGTFLTDRLGINLGWSDGARHLVIHADLLGTDSDYLPDDGFVVGNFALRFVNEAAAVPYRLEAGDVFADMSRRVLQRQIRGTMLEFQPSLGSGTHSLMLLAGSGVPDWRHTFDDGGDLTFTGASWLWQSASQKTSLVANVMSESAKAGAKGAVPVPVASLDHRVASLFAKTGFAGMNFETEVSVLDAGNGSADDGTSYYAELARATGALQWRARYEDNEREYLPFGAMGVLAGHSTAEAQARWIMTPRTSLRARVQRIDSEQLSAATGTSIDLAGAHFETRPVTSRPGFVIQLMADANRTEADDRTRDVLFQNYGIEVRDWLTDVYDLTLRSWFRETSDDVRPVFDRESHDYELVVGKALRGGGRWSGRIGGGVAYRTQRGNGPYDTLSPLAELSLRGGPHTFRLNYGYVDQNLLAPGAHDVTYQNRRAMYAFLLRNHEVSLEYGQELREPDGLPDTDSSRIALRYRFAFDRSF